MVLNRWLKLSIMYYTLKFGSYSLGNNPLPVVMSPLAIRAQLVPSVGEKDEQITFLDLNSTSDTIEGAIVTAGMLVSKGEVRKQKQLQMVERPPSVMLVLLRSGSGTAVVALLGATLEEKRALLE